MGIGFQQFAKSQQRSTPQLIQAEIARAKMANEAEQAKNAQRSQNLIGAGMLYNQGMGDKSPIADYLSNALRSGGEEQAGNLGMALEQPAAELAAEQTPTLLEASGSGPFGMGGIDAASTATEGIPALTDTAGTGAFGMGDAAGAAGDTGIPIVSALRGGQQLAEGDVGGAAGTGAKAWMSTLGPWGMGLAGLLGLTGIL